MQVQSASDPPKKLALGERAVQADGNEYNLFQLQGGRPAGRAGLRHRRHAAGGRPERHLQERAESERRAAVPELSASAAECQQLIIDVGGLRSVHPQTKEKPGRKPLKEIKTMKEDAAGVEKNGEEIKVRYTKLFKV